ncbi:hypothetical protein BBJ29_000936 [Phytophthora kernoviae]|uniref:FYVE-type domain-containing protein n=1 Tax=Phytophthora kernoviae TaxID=325452 RepID=A0A3F2RYB0_9STRA|nr:hypothetical protein BBJ29_000936 [Phytophthora kernoviae]RLN66103.1 hypothetical protein BBP00_00002439 [Phytophthora kernoviae]
MAMSSIFPLPRAQLPEVAFSRHEQRALKRMIRRMLKHTVQEFDRYTHDKGGAIDASRWKSVGSKDDLRVFRERESGAMSAALAPALDKTEILSHGSTVAPLTAPGILMTGFTRGKVENAMDVVTTKTQEDLMLMLSFMYHEDVVDCAVLNTMENSTETDPFHFLGVKYVVRKATALRHRDSVYLEYTGYTETARGERLGYHLMHSIELPKYPDLAAFNSMRTLQSVRYLYHQQSDDIVEVFMQGNLILSGTVVKSAFTNDSIFSITALVACAETKRLSQMRDAHQVTQEQRKQEAKRAALALECTMCRQKKKLFGGASIAACGICSEFTCSRCRSDKKVFKMNDDGVLGKFLKLSVCKVCILAANKALSQTNEPKMHIVMSEQIQQDSEASRERRRRGTSSTASSESRSRSGSSSTLSASSDDHIPAPRTLRRDRIGSGLSTPSALHATNYRECPVAPMSPMGMRTQARGHHPVYADSDPHIELHLQHYGPRFNVVKSSTEQAHRIQHFGNIGGQRVQQQLATRKQNPTVLEPPEAVQGRMQALTVSTHRVKDLRPPSSYPSTPSAQNDLFARMVELNRVAESTYNTTQRNNAYVSQQLRAARK